MSNNRYRYDTGSVIDQSNGDILTTRQAVNRLNKQDTLVKRARNHHQAVIDALNEEIKKADTQELKEALIRISQKRLYYD